MSARERVARGLKGRTEGCAMSCSGGCAHFFRSGPTCAGMIATHDAALAELLRSYQYTA